MDDTLLSRLNDERTSLLTPLLSRTATISAGRRSVSGIAWQRDLLVTAAEPVAGAQSVQVLTESGKAAAEVLAADLTTDVAVLRLPGGAHSAPPAGAALTLGAQIAVLGREARGAVVAWGAVRLVGPAWRSRRGGAIAQRVELDVRFDPALEGGAVIDVRGRIAALAVAGPYGRVLGIPHETIASVVTQVERLGRVPQPYLGLRLQPLWLDAATRKRLGRAGRTIAVVSGVDADSPAAQAHVELGDLLLGVDGRLIEGADDLTAAIVAAGPGRLIALEVLRAGAHRQIEITVRERPAA